ncbi:YcaO-like family protein [Streptomyces sp. NPDC014991]|uniref:YcaO-like family protein n=1 Tax=Streptomyces sp. NPDC014991 TaxID=3364935 RepID=UPI0036FEF84F
MNASTPGTLRTRTPEDTWEALAPEIPHLGISRVARLTGLDHLGIPVWTAVRPAAHTLVTSQGKGADDLLAKISAVLEAAELWHAERPVTVATRATHRELRLPYPMAALPVKVAHPALADIPLDWVTGRGLHTMAEVLVPADLLRREMHHGPVRPEVFAVTSNGLACGNNRHEATLHALLETVERDVLHRDWESGGRRRTLVDPASVTDPYCADLIRRFLDAGMWLEIVHVDNPYAIPVFAAYIWSEDYPIVFAGSGCHGLPEIALSRALTEAAQSRLTCIAGTRDDLDSHEAAFAAQPGRPELAELPAGTWADCTGPALDLDLDLDLEPDVTRLLQQTVTRVTGITGHEPIAVTLREAEAYAAVKVISPGMEMRITRSIPRTRERHG